MRIAYVYDAVFPYVKGGVERRIQELSRRLVDRGHEVHLFGMQWWQGDHDLEQDGIHVHGCCKAHPLYRQGRRTFLSPALFAASVAIPLIRERFDIIDCQQFPYFPAFSALIAGRLRRSRVVITWHEVWGDYWYRYLGGVGALGKATERVLARATTLPVAVSDATREGMERAGVAGDIPVIPVGIDHAWIRDITPSPMKSDIIFVGRLIPEKHVDLLIEAVSLIRSENPFIRCMIIGDGPERPSLEVKARELDLSESVHFTGFLDKSEDVIACMKSSRIFVFPSSREGFGISVLEALACGLPVVTSDDPGNASRVFIRNGCGRLSSLEKNDLAENVLHLLSGTGYDPEQCREQSLAYDWEMVTDKAEEYYRKILRE